MVDYNAVLAGLLEFLPEFLFLAALSEDILLLLRLWSDCWSCMASSQVCYFGYFDLQIDYVVAHLGQILVAAICSLVCCYIQLGMLCFLKLAETMVC